VQLILEVLVHRIDHPVAEAPQQEERGDEEECDGVVLAIGRAEEARFRGRCGG
jgi:hypothetical protein